MVCAFPFMAEQDHKQDGIEPIVSYILKLRFRSLKSLSCWGNGREIKRHDCLPSLGLGIFLQSDMKSKLFGLKVYFQQVIYWLNHSPVLLGRSRLIDFILSGFLLEKGKESTMVIYTTCRIQEYRAGLPSGGTVAQYYYLGSKRSSGHRVNTQVLYHPDA